MTIQELAKMASSSKDTIRVYREKGLLHPKKNKDNNYFIYTLKDFCTLLFIKKMRYFDMSLGSIKDLLNGSNPHLFISHYDEQIKLLKIEQKRIQTQINHLNMAKDFLEATMYQEEQIYEMAFETCRYDIYPDLLKKDEQYIYHDMLKDSAIYINTIYATKEDLMDESRQDVPIHTGLGIDTNVLKRYKISVPSQAIIFPSGMYLVSLIKTEDLHFIPRERLQPLINYAQEYQYTITGGITSFLAYIDNTNGAFYYRVRIPVEKQL